METLVSCVCVTKNVKDLVHRSIDCFLKQTYKNKELILLYETDNPDTDFFTKFANEHTNIKLIAVPVEPKKTLGELRNIAIEASSGEYFMQWDDDDWYNPDRINYQMSQLDGSKANILSRWIFFDMVTKKAYLSHVRKWEGSILCAKEIFMNSEKYPHWSKSEDNCFINSIDKHIRVINQPYIYVYVYHTNNTWHYYHFLNNFRHSTDLGESTSQLINNLLCNSVNLCAEEQMRIIDSINI